MLVYLSLAAALVLAACAPEPARVALAPAPCQLAWDGGTRAKANGLQVVEVPDAGELVRAYNEAPPVSDLHPEHVYIIRRDRETGFVVLVIGSCIAGHMPLTPHVLALLERGGA